MNILITAGGTSENIDSVRSITNHSTGRLGSIIADFFLNAGNTVTYITTPQSLRPNDHKELKLKEITTTQELEKTLLSLFKNQTFDAIIHSMAVSDFRPEIFLSQEDFTEKLTNEIMTLSEPINRTNLSEKINKLFVTEINNTTKINKISSQSECSLLFLKKNPKIISMIRKQQPTALLIGFKLLVNVTEKELIRVSKKILIENHCDYVLANDLNNITEHSHKAILLDMYDNKIYAETKTEIAQLIIKKVEQTKEDIL